MDRYSTDVASNILVSLFVTEMFKEAGANVIADVYQVWGRGGLVIISRGASWVVIRKCREVCISSVGELGSGRHVEVVPCGVFSQLCFFQVEGSHETLSRAIIIAAQFPPMVHEAGEVCYCGLCEVILLLPFGIGGIIGNNYSGGTRIRTVTGHNSCVEQRLTIETDPLEFTSKVGLGVRWLGFDCLASKVSFMIEFLCFCHGDFDIVVVDLDVIAFYYCRCKIIPNADAPVFLVSSNLV